MDTYILVAAFFLIALIYSSVGFAGGTSYVALLAVMKVDYLILRPAALLCNILVAIGGTIIFAKEGLIDWRKNWPFLVAGIPCSYLGGKLPISEVTFFRVLGITLIAASIVLWIQRKADDKKPKETKSAVLPLGIGGALGFLSGVSSIGGGIFLSPTLHFINWDQAKKISALASVFILLNSISGLYGQLSRSSRIDWDFVWPLLIAVFLGGQLGSRLGARRFNPVYIKRITAALILLAGINIVKDHL